MSLSTSAEEPTKEDQWRKLFTHMLGNQATWVADIGLKAGLFRTIATHPDGIDEKALARHSNYAPQYVQAWCRAAYAVELLD